MKELASEIYEAVGNGRLAQPFNAAMLKKACRAGRIEHIKHSLGNIPLEMDKQQNCSSE